ncbi:HTH-type transcriptional regulator BetI [Mycolicibacterium vanbaalenii]|uniref:HTH-type transcriptional regulator BetI n=1 Tax=Mycolicibacterium vanbaalenii TaxID=110539 RepID=A0A5S9QCG1_MYCVN|nr:TetR family transcriptional regulator [Mycolicibacterium vanbaalenii]CAA0114914.1 HTH-type transcriptional regulator BetI [Mycolicibacterium vanbaalenii]
MAEVRGEPALGLRERKKRRTRATLIDAAVALCDRQGFDGTTVDQIAAVADVSPRTFSRYFATKDAIATALIDEVLSTVARELVRLPRELGQFEALRRAYIAMAQGTRRAPAGALTSDRLLQIMRIIVTSPALRHAATEYRASAVDTVMAQRLGTTVGDRRIKLIAAVWAAVLMTALTELTDDLTTGGRVEIDDMVAVLDLTYAEFAGEIAGLGQAV